MHREIPPPPEPPPIRKVRDDGTGVPLGIALLWLLLFFLQKGCV